MRWKGETTPQASKLIHSSYDAQNGFINRIPSFQENAKTKVKTSEVSFGVYIGDISASISGELERRDSST